MYPGHSPFLAIFFNCGCAAALGTLNVSRTVSKATLGLTRVLPLEGHVDEFVSLFGDTPLANIPTWQVEKWKAEQGRTLNPATVNRRLTVLKHLFKKAVDWGLMGMNPAQGVKHFPGSSERMRFLTKNEIKRLLEVCEAEIPSPWLLPLVTLALNTRMRQGELLSLKWENVDLDRGSIIIIQSKMLRAKTIAINDQGKRGTELVAREPIRRASLHVALGRSLSAR